MFPAILPNRNVSGTAGRDSWTAGSCCRRVGTCPHPHPSSGVAFASLPGSGRCRLASTRQGRGCKLFFHTYSAPIYRQEKLISYTRVRQVPLGELAVSQLASIEKEHYYCQMQTSGIIKHCNAYQLLQELLFRVDFSSQVKWCSTSDGVASLSVWYKHCAGVCLGMN